MEKSRKIIDIVFKTISKLSDEEIEGIINKEGKLVYVKDEKVIKKENGKRKNVLAIFIISSFFKLHLFKILYASSLEHTLSNSPHIPNTFFLLPFSFF